MRKTRDWRCDEERIIRESCNKTAGEIAKILIYRSPGAITARARMMGIMLPSRTKRLTITTEKVKTVRGMVKRLGIEETAKRLNLKPESVRRKIYPAKN